MANPIINIKFLADLKNFSSGMQNANRKMDQLGKKLKNTGSTLSVGLTAPLLAFGAVAVSNYDKQAKALAQVEQGLKSTGNAVGFTSDELQKMASEFQNNSLFGDEDILKNVTAQMLTFTNVTGEQFKRTSQAALDLATRLDGDLKSSSIQLGKALNDPVLGLSALAKSGIQFSEDQKKVIKSLVETGDLAGAQNLILSELETQYGGSAKAAAEAGTGGFKQLSNIIGDITEDFGKVIVEGLKPFVANLKEMALRFQNLSPETKKWIVILAGVAAAIGPILLLAGTILPALTTGFALLTGPIGLVVAALVAVGVAIYKNWEPIKKTLVDIANYFVDLYNESTIFRLAVEGISTSFKNVFRIGKFVFTTIGNIISLVANTIKDIFINLGAGIKAVLTGNFSELGSIFKKNFNDNLENVKEFVAKSTLEFQDLNKDITSNIKEGLNNGFNGRKYKLEAENVDVSEVKNKVAGAINNGLNGGGGDGGPFTPQTEKLQTQSLGIANPIKPIHDQLIESTAGVKVAIQETADELTEFQEVADQIGLGVGDAFENMSARFVESLGLAKTGFQGFVAGLVGTITKLISMLLANSIANAIAGATASGAATGPAAIFTTPAFITTAVSGVVAAFASIPKFEHGGIVGGSSFYGDKILARVNSGELILNQDQQKDVFGLMAKSGSNVIIPDARIKGEDIIIAYKRAEKKRNRKG